MVSFKTLLAPLLFSFASAQSAASVGGAWAVPAPPTLNFLYTSFVDIAAPTDYGVGPYGDRAVIPITGGNFTGPKLSGKDSLQFLCHLSLHYKHLTNGLQGSILNLGADWGSFDAKGIFYPDTRYGFLTNDGAHIYLRTSGALQASGNINLRVVLETGDSRYYWLNGVVGEFQMTSGQSSNINPAVGILKQVSGTPTTGGVLRIDVWYF